MCRVLGGFAVYFVANCRECITSASSLAAVLVLKQGPFERLIEGVDGQCVQ